MKRRLTNRNGNKNLYLTGKFSAGVSRFATSSIGDILGQERNASDSPSPEKQPVPGGQSIPLPTDTNGQVSPGGDVLAHIMRELAKAIEEGRLKPVVIGPYEMDIPGQARPSGTGQSQTPGADIFGQILRDLLSGKGGQVQGQSASLMDGVGAAVFGDRLEAGRDVDQSQRQRDAFQEVFARFANIPRR